HHCARQGECQCDQDQLFADGCSFQYEGHGAILTLNKQALAHALSGRAACRCQIASGSSTSPTAPSSRTVAPTTSAHCFMPVPRLFVTTGCNPRISSIASANRCPCALSTSTIPFSGV